MNSKPGGHGSGTLEAGGLWLEFCASRANGREANPTMETVVNTEEVAISASRVWTQTGHSIFDAGWILRHSYSKDTFSKREGKLHASSAVESFLLVWPASVWGGGMGGCVGH